jgi:hypothetical protein
VRLLDLQASPPAAYRQLLQSWRPDAIGFSLNYLANVPEVIDCAVDDDRHRSFVPTGRTPIMAQPSA